MQLRSFRVRGRIMRPGASVTMVDRAPPKLQVRCSLHKHGGTRLITHSGRHPHSLGCPWYAAKAGATVIFRRHIGGLGARDLILVLTDGSSAAPKILKPCCGGPASLGARAYRGRVREGVAAGVAEHAAMDREGQTRACADALDEAVDCVGGEWPATLGGEHEGAVRELPA